ncbi:hypothetical protein ACOMHN_012694 [Nucella lapillus]
MKDKASSTGHLQWKGDWKESIFRAGMSCDMTACQCHGDLCSQRVSMDIRKYLHSVTGRSPATFRAAGDHTGTEIACPDGRRNRTLESTEAKKEIAFARFSP